MDLNAMIAERNRLDQQIRQAQEDRRTAWNTRLDELMWNLTAWLDEQGIQHAASERKGVMTVIIAGRVHVDFPYRDEQWSAEHVDIWCAGDSPGRYRRIAIEVDPLNVSHAEFSGLVGVLLGRV